MAQKFQELYAQNQKDEEVQEVPLPDYPKDKDGHPDWVEMANQLYHPDYQELVQFFDNASYTPEKFNELYKEKYVHAQELDAEGLDLVDIPEGGGIPKTNWGYD